MQAALPSLKKYSLARLTLHWKNSTTLGKDVMMKSSADRTGLRQAIPVPGHTAGMQVFLIPEDRVAIFGDACGEMTLLAKEILPTYVAALRHLQVYQDQFDTVLRNHGTFWSDKRILQDNLELAEDAYVHVVISKSSGE